MGGPNDFLPMPYKRNITNSDISPVQKLDKIAKSNDRLIVDYHERKDYVLSGSYLKLLMEYDMIESMTIKKIFLLLCKPVLKDFIETNINNRIKATKAGDTSTSELCKLSNNAVYGSTLLSHEALSNNINSITVKNLPKFIVRKGVNNFLVYGDRALVSRKANSADVSNNIAIGWMILNYSKMVMYRFWHEFKTFAKETYDTDISLYYTDTDSFFINIDFGEHTDETLKDMYLKLREHKCGRLFDFGSLKCDIKNVDDKPYKTHGLVSSELVLGDDITRAAFLAPKVYCYDQESGKSVSKGKGVIGEMQKSIFTFDNLTKLMYNFNDDVIKPVEYYGFKKTANDIRTEKFMKRIRNSNIKLHVEEGNVHLFGYKR